MEELYKDFKRLLLYRLKDMKGLEESLLPDYIESLIADLEEDRNGTKS